MEDQSILTILQLAVRNQVIHQVLVFLETTKTPHLDTRVYIKIKSER